jgi:hypothetical protein
MIRTATIATALAVIAGLYCNTAMADHDSSSCGNATVQGDYGQLANATLPTSGEDGGPVSSNPLVTVGLLTFDGKGGITGRATGVMAGVATPVTVKGTYSVATDCTLTITADLFTSSQETSTTAAAAAAPSGNRIDTITLQGVVVQRATRINAIVTRSMRGVQTGSGVFDSVR